MNRSLMDRSPVSLSCLLAALAVLLGSVGAGTPARGQDLVYEPVNPAFGGSPVNYQWLLNSAKTQNPYQQDGFDPFDRSGLQNFEEQVQRQVLDQLAREIVQQRFGEDIDLSQEGQYDFQNFTVDVTPGPGGIRIRVFNKETGEESTIEIPRY